MVVWCKKLEFVVSFSGGKLLKQLPDFILFGLLKSHRRQSGLNPTVPLGPLRNLLPRLIILMKRLEFETYNESCCYGISPKVRMFYLGAIVLQHKLLPEQRYS